MDYHIRMRKFIFGIFISLCLFGCSSNTQQDSPEKDASKPNSNAVNIIDCPAEIAQSAFEYAVLYSKADTVYDWGGQDPLRAIKLDCSGLVTHILSLLME